MYIMYIEIGNKLFIYNLIKKMKGTDYEYCPFFPF
jgi:hypothetical protein